MSYTVDEPGAIGMFVSDNITFNYTDATWIVLHKTAGFTSAADCAAYFQSGSNGKNVSAHYIVGQGENEVIQCVPESRGSGANCCTIGSYASYLPYCDGQNDNMNLHSISIEHIDPAIDNSTPLTEAQKAASFQLIKHICQRHNIPMRGGDASGGIIGHMDIDPINRARCPGNYPWSDLWNYLSNGEETTMLNLGDPMGSFFVQAPGNAWSCPSKNTVLGNAMLDFFRQHGGAFGLPLTNEFGLSQYAGVTFQVMERAIQVYGALPGQVPPGAGNVYLLQIMSGLGQQMIAKSLVSSLQSQVSDLTTQVNTLKSQLAQAGDSSALQAQITALQTQLNSYKQACTNVITTLQKLGE